MITALLNGISAALPAILYIPTFSPADFLSLFFSPPEAKVP